MLLTELMALRGPSGCEDEVREAIRREAEHILSGRDGRVFCDAIGNLYACRSGVEKKRAMLCAPMDEVGLIVRFATQEGLLRFDCVGPVDPRVLPSKRVKIGKDGVDGVVGCKAAHLLTPEEEERAPEVSQLSIDIGVSSKDEAERLCPKGSYAVLDGEPGEFGDGFIRGREAGGRAGCAILLDALENSDYAGELVCVFSAQKRVGLRGAKVAARRVEPDLAIVVDGTEARDMGGVKPHLRGVACGKGAVLARMDGGMIADRALLQKALEAAERENIPVQPQRMPSGTTDAAAVHLQNAGVPCLTVGIPCRYPCTPTSVAKRSDIEAARLLTAALLREI